MSDTVYLSWEDPVTREWGVVGRLTALPQCSYEFAYTPDAQKLTNFQPLCGMEDFSCSYRSEELFPVFRNRLMSTRRKNYVRYLEWMNLTAEETTSINILARSYGVRHTDTFRVFEKLAFDEDGGFNHKFFAEVDPNPDAETTAYIAALVPGETLRLVRKENDVTVLIETLSGDRVGRLPRYIAEELEPHVGLNSQEITVTMVAVNQDAPYHYRLLCLIHGAITN